MLTAMARDPNERFATMERFLDALRAPAQPWASTPGADASVAVLPFANMSADPENEYFGDGIARRSSTRWRRCRGCGCARTSAFSFKGRATIFARSARS
jgi:TolB-like protein